MKISETLASGECWNDFWVYRTVMRHLGSPEKKQLEDFISEKRYLPMAEALAEGRLVLHSPRRSEISKHSGAKKRVVYLYEGDELIFLKMLAYSLSVKYDSLFGSNCYAFRRNLGAGDAVRRLVKDPQIRSMYCLKTDLHDYFNSIPVMEMLGKLSFLKDEDGDIYTLLKQMLLQGGGCGDDLPGGRGVMAGTPTSSFLANLYLADLDSYFEQKDIKYFRYSDDILIFANDRDELEELEKILCERVEKAGLSFNPAKRQLALPGDELEFLGFSFKDGQVGLSKHTVQKIKGKIRRKARALGRWADRKGLSGEKAAKGFIKVMNLKFFDDEEKGDFSWSRWFFPYLSSGDDLKEIDEYMQKYARFCVTGRHYKGNYRVTYEMLKEWGYRSLVAEYYSRNPEKNNKTNKLEEKYYDI